MEWGKVDPRYARSEKDAGHAGGGKKKRK